MKVLVIAPRFHTNLYYQVIALQNSGSEVKVAVVYQGKSEYYKNIDIQVIHLSFFSKTVSNILHIFNKNTLKSDFELRIQTPGKELKKIVSTFKPDTVILKAYQNLLALNTLRICKKTKIKVVLHTQTDKMEVLGSRFLFKLNMKLFHHLKVHAYITPILSNYSNFKAFGIENVHYLPFVFPVPQNTIPLFLKQNEVLKILMVGKYTKRKDQMLLIEAVEELHTTGMNIELTIFGELSDIGYFNVLKACINTYDAMHYIRLHENIPYEEILKEYTKHHLYVLPSYNEPAAYSIVEAMAHALPVICSDRCGTQSYIENEVNGYVFKSKDKDDLIEKIRRVLIDPIHYETLSKGALKKATSLFNPDGFADSIKKIDL
jgi:glycosyltransferase involved in cell wall biosynthesis